jgi:hypothetical protein
MKRSLGIDTPAFSSVFTSISCDSSIRFPFGSTSKKLRIRGFLPFVCVRFAELTKECFGVQLKSFPSFFSFGWEENSPIFLH